MTTEWDDLLETIGGQIRRIISLQERVDRYGGNDLRRGDHGKDVGALQRDLSSLGYRFVKRSQAEEFDNFTEWAVREFQVYTNMPRVAREDPAAAGNYLQRLSPVQNTATWCRPTGVVDRATRVALSEWVENNWRCPVVIGAWAVTAGRPTGVWTNDVYPDAEQNVNIWFGDDVGSAAPRMFARDSTGYYTFPAGQNPDELIVLGEYAPAQGGLPGGPRCVPGTHTWPQAEVRPELLIGHAPGDAAEFSTYRVVRAVADVECGGFFDCYNGWDDTFTSQGIFHWALAVEPTGSYVPGELGEVLEHLAADSPNAFREALGRFGLGVRDRWVTLQAPGGAEPVPLQPAQLEYFRSWPWVYRFCMAARTVPAFQQAQWPMAIARLRRVLSFQPGAAAPPQVALPARTTLGNIFTSEVAVALLLRWHVFRPGHVVGGAQQNHLMLAFRNAVDADAGLWSGTAPPNQWTDDHERSLIEAVVGYPAAKLAEIEAAAEGSDLRRRLERQRGTWESLSATLPRVRNSRHWVARPVASTNRDSFHLAQE
jgi:hypothetical protein